MYSKTSVSVNVFKITLVRENENFFNLYCSKVSVSLEEVWYAVQLIQLTPVLFGRISIQTTEPNSDDFVKKNDLMLVLRV